MEDPRHMASHTDDDDHSECLFCHLKAIRTLVRKGLERYQLAHCIEAQPDIDIGTGDDHQTDGLNTYWCVINLSLGLGVVQPLVSVITLGEGLYVDRIAIANAIVAESIRLHARREQLATARRRMRQTAITLIAAAAADEIEMELLSIELMGYVPELGPQDVEDLFRIEILMLTEVRDRTEMDRVTIHAADSISLADHLKAMLPAQRLLSRRLAERPGAG